MLAGVISTLCLLQRGQGIDIRFTFESCLRWQVVPSLQHEAAGAVFAEFGGFLFIEHAEGFAGSERLRDSEGRRRGETANGEAADLEQRLGPEASLGDEFPLDELAGAVVGHTEKRADDIAVVVEDLGMEGKYAHCLYVGFSR